MAETLSDTGQALELEFTDRSGKHTSVRCDSIHLIAADGVDGLNGGAIGIRRGHVPAVISLGKGTIFALLEGKRVFEREISGGLASVSNNKVTVLV